MAKTESPYCPECNDAFDYPAPPPVDRRNFLRTAAAGAAAVAVTGTVAARAVAREEKKADPSEELVRELFSTLKDEQKKKVVFAFDHGAQKDKPNVIPTRMGMYNGPIMNIRLGDAYTKAQQDLI